MYIDFRTRLGITDEPNHTFSTYKYLMGIKIQYRDFLLILTYLIVITIIVIGVFLLLFIIERN